MAKVRTGVKVESPKAKRTGSYTSNRPSGKTSTQSQGRATKVGNVDTAGARLSKYRG